MKTIIKQGLWLVLFTMALTSCLDQQQGETRLQFDFNFATSQHGWSGDFADYPVGEEEFYELNFSYDTLPAPLDNKKKALRLHGSNRSDDLFFFAKKQLTNLTANTEYELVFDVQLASNFPMNSVGIGGGPGTSSFVKVGAAATEPTKVAEDGFYQFSLDKGNQSQSGKHALVIGTLGIPGNDFVYKLIRRHNIGTPLKAKTDEQGNLWVFVGMDSGYEGITNFYITNVKIQLLPVR